MGGEERQRARQALAEFLSTVNLKGGSTWPYELKTLPRPTGRGTRVVSPEYDLPRATIQPHDVIVDPDGIAWYCNFGEQTLGKLDPRTGRVTEYRVPELKPGFPTGALSVRFDRDSNLWLGMMFQGGIAKFERKKETFSTWSLPPEVNRDMTQVNMTSPSSSHVDGKVWTNNNGFAAVHRLDLASGKFETWEPFREGVAKGRNHNIYDVIADSMLNDRVLRLDTKTGAFTEYLLPRSTNIRRVFVDSSTTPVAFWVGSNHGASIVKLEPLD